MILKQSGKEKYIAKANPVKPPVLSESEPQAMDEVSIRCEAERSGSVFAGYILFLAGRTVNHVRKNLAILSEAWYDKCICGHLADGCDFECRQKIQEGLV